MLASARRALTVLRRRPLLAPLATHGLWGAAASLSVVGACALYSVSAPALALQAAVAPAEKAESPIPADARLASDLFSGVAPVTSAWLLASAVDGSADIMLRTSFTDLASNEDRDMSHALTLDCKSGEWLTRPSFPAELRDVVLRAPSPSGKRLASVRVATVEGKKQQFIELWESGSLVSSIPVDDAHGKVMANASFGRLSWNAAEDAVVYSAERSPLSVSTLWARDPAAPRRGEANDYKHKEDWGEQLEGVRFPRVYVASFAAGRITPVVGVPEGMAEDAFSAGVPMFSPDGKHIVYIGFNHTPYRLGLVFCINRPRGLFVAPVPIPSSSSPSSSSSSSSSSSPSSSSSSSSSPPAVHPRVSSSLDTAVEAPVFSPSGDLYYLGTSEAHTHKAGMVLRAVSWPVGPEGPSVRAVVPTVPLPEKGAFPGLYPATSPVRGCWRAGKGGSDVLFVNTMWGSRLTFVGVDTATGTVTDIGARIAALVNSDPTLQRPGGGRGYHSTSLLDSNSQGWLVRVESPVHLPLVVFVPHSLDKVSVCPLHPYSPRMRDLYASLEWDLFDVVPDEGGPPFEAFVIKPRAAPHAHSLTLADTAKGKSGLVVFPHGGPHMAQATTLAQASPLLCAHGLAVLLVNYRGSMGFGEAALHSLPGRAGSADVADVVAATRTALARHGDIDGGRVGVMGASHGGFLGAHLIGQHPQLYKAGVFWNPVLNVVANFTFSDIPDWSQVEAGTEGRMQGKMTRVEEAVKMFNASPIAHIDKIVAPTLLVVSGKDKRVPPGQSFEFARELKLRGVPTKTLYYPEENHGIYDPVAYADVLVQSLRWFNQHLPQQ